MLDLKGIFFQQWAGMRLDTPMGMTPPADRLLRHLALAIALKLVVLTVLWWAFVQDARVGVDVERAAAHLGAPGRSHSMPAGQDTAAHGATP